MEEKKNKAKLWVDTFFKQKQEILYNDLDTAVKNQDIDKIVSLADELNNLKVIKVEFIESIEDSINTIELLRLVINDDEFDEEEMEDYVMYIMNV